MADIQRGHTFVDGGTASAADFNASVDAATILPGFILGKAQVPPSTADSFVYVTGVTNELKRTTFGNLVASLPGGSGGGAAASVSALRQLGTLPLQAAAGNDVRFPARLTGVRMANGTAADTVAKPKDLSFVSYNLNGGSLATQTIDWNLSEVFYDTVTVNRTYQFSNMQDGRAITLALKLGAHTLTWPSLFGAIPATNSAATVHYFTFIKSALSANPSGFVIAI